MESGIEGVLESNKYMLLDQITIVRSITLFSMITLFGL